ncbi:MAG TPA: 2-amino-4-hydroxy-6-hydroxymethyldihydropteridine diphosphokinase [Stellaceae bacterium]|nr:2-amino-4-hydroxy-6-hydroxymethyldihydropteridine diphosphokinase [Stellaceae bacterium]
MILLGIGSNLPHPPAASPRETAAAAVAALPRIGVCVVAQSSWYASEPVPASDQPWFVNGVAIVATALNPETLLSRMLDLETEFGRIRGVPNASRTLDLDLLDYDALLIDTPTLILPHPRMHLRRFVLEPLREVAPGWRHPRFDLSAVGLLDRLLPPGQVVVRLDG